MYVIIDGVCDDLHESELLYILLECSQSVTKHFLVTSPTMAILLLLAQILSSPTSVQN
jgi:hypothetical protein